MVELTLENACLATVLAYSALGWLVLTGIKINYGRLKSSLSSIYINPKFGWFFFEVPNLLWAAYFLLVEGSPLSLPYSLFILHYLNRDIIYPLTLKSATTVPLEIMLSAFSFTFANGYLQGIANQRSAASTINPAQQILGVVLFVVGMATNIWSDRILQQTKQKLRKDKSNKYVRIDRFLFKYVSNPNYLGEIIEWIGYSLVSGHPYGALFAFSTFNVLVPAAMVRSGWNKKNIEGYPKERKAVIPYIL